MRGETINIQVLAAFYVESCYSCGVPFGISGEHRRILLNEGQTFYCPNGHGQVYRDTLRQELQAARQTVRDLRAANDDLLTTIASKGKEINRMQKRAAAGVCQQCHRTFQNVARHVAMKHGAK